MATWLCEADTLIRSRRPRRLPRSYRFAEERDRGSRAGSGDPPWDPPHYRTHKAEVNPPGKLTDSNFSGRRFRDSNRDARMTEVLLGVSKALRSPAPVVSLSPSPCRDPYRGPQALPQGRIYFAATGNANVSNLIHSWWCVQSSFTRRREMQYADFPKTHESPGQGAFSPADGGADWNAGLTANARSAHRGLGTPSEGAGRQFPGLLLHCFVLLARLKEITHRQKITHSEIARRAGTSRTRVTSILNDDLQHVSSDLLIRILASLGYRVKVSVVRPDSAA
jgi:hypothetical protein